jgi:hypothetical protein
MDEPYDTKYNTTSTLKQVSFTHYQFLLIWFLIFMQVVDNPSVSGTSKVALHVNKSEQMTSRSQSEQTMTSSRQNNKVG